MQMDKPTRAKLIIDLVLALDEKFGRSVPPRSLSSTSRVRLITDNPIWQAQWTIEHETGPDGEAWDLFELAVHGQPALTAGMRGDRVVPRYYIPGKWEQIFIETDLSDTVPLLGN